MSPSEKYDLAERLRPYEEAAAKERQINNDGGRGRKKPSEKFAQGLADSRRATAKVAAAVGWSRPTVS